MASNDPTRIAYRHYFHRRKEIISALTTGIDGVLEKCRTVLPGAKYMDRYVLKVKTDEAYTVEHPTSSFVGELEPPNLPLYCGHMTERIWLDLAIETSNAWLHGTIMFDIDPVTASDKEKLRFLKKIEQLPELKSDILHFHHKHPRAQPVTPAALRTMEELSPCENKSCWFASNVCWIECIICCRWYHCACVGISPSDRFCKHHFICESC